MVSRYEIRVVGRLTPAVTTSFGQMRAWVVPRVTILRVRLADGTDPARLVELLSSLGVDVVTLRRVRPAP
jgi:hypothetical protein